MLLRDCEFQWAGEVVGEGVFHEIEGGLGGLPGLETGFLPIGQILGVDGFAFELGIHDRLDLRQRLKPLEQAFVLFAAMEAAIKFFTDGMGRRPNLLTRVIYIWWWTVGSLD